MTGGPDPAPTSTGRPPGATSVRQLLAAMPLVRVEELPRWAGAGASQAADLALPQRLAATVAAYHSGAAGAAGAPIACGWLREGPEEPLHVLVGGEALIPTAGEAVAALAYPPAARGSRLPETWVRQHLAAFPCWVEVGIQQDPLSRPDDHDRAGVAGTLRPSLEDGLLGAWREPFVWLLVARPVSATDLAERKARAAAEMRTAQMHAGRSIEHAVDAERAEHLYRELRRGETQGVWWATLLVGARSAQAAHGVAGLLCASADLDGLPYVLQPPASVRGLDLLEDAGPPAPERWPVSSELLARVGRPPLREVGGVRFVLQPEFDVTAEPAYESGHVELGAVLDRNRTPSGRMQVSLDTLNRHAFVCGATGAGKSQTVRHMLEQLSAGDIPWLVVEPAKAEYRRMAARLGANAGVVVIRPGDPQAPPAGLNPLEPEPGFPLQTHVDLVRELFLAAFDAQEPFPQVLAAALTRCYEDLGWDLVLGRPHVAMDPPCYPTLGDLEGVARQVVAEIGYGPEVMANVRGFMEVRLRSLRLGTTGHFLEGGHALDVGRLLRSRVVLEIEDVGNDQDKAFLMGAILIRLVEHLRVAEQQRQGEPGRPVEHVTVFEEAHRLLRRPERQGPAAHAVELFASLLAEVRAYREAIVVVEQIPAKLLGDVIKNTALKVLHRLPAQDDRETVGATMNTTEPQTEYVATLRPGEAACSTDGMDYPLLVRLPDGTAAEAQPAPVTPAGGVIARASPCCGPQCRDRACTLAEMREAKRLLERGDLAVWVELVLLAHLVGPSRPAPGSGLLEWTRTLDDRRFECAVAQAAVRGVRGRAAALCRHFSPLALAEHAVDVVRAQRAGAAVPCVPEEWQWQAGPFRWYSVRKELRAARSSGAVVGQHVRTAEWEERYGRRLVGSLAEQEEVVRRWVEAEEGWRETVLFGAESPSPLEEAVGCRRGEPQWADRLSLALQALVLRSPWPLRYLAAEGG